jgi:hypothetical protein
MPETAIDENSNLVLGKKKIRRPQHVPWLNNPSPEGGTRKSCPQSHLRRSVPLASYGGHMLGHFRGNVSETAARKKDSKSSIHASNPFVIEGRHRGSEPEQLLL